MLLLIIVGNNVVSRSRNWWHKLPSWYQITTNQWSQSFVVVVVLCHACIISPMHRVVRLYCWLLCQPHYVGLGQSDIYICSCLCSTPSLFSYGHACSPTSLFWIPLLGVEHQGSHHGGPTGLLQIATLLHLAGIGYIGLRLTLSFSFSFPSCP